MPKRALTAAAVDRLKPPASGQVEHFDAGFPGLALRISYGGGRSWVFFYRAHGKQRRLTLGTYPAMSLAEAREAWRTARAAVDRGEDPAAAKAEAKRREPDTVRSVGEAVHHQVREAAEPDRRRGGADARAAPLPGPRAAGRSRPSPAATCSTCSTASKRSPRGARANRVLANVRRLFSWAVERGIIEASPAANVKAPGQETSRDRVLTDDELRAFLRACDRMGEPFGPLLRLLLLTGQRREEVAALPWAELDLAGGRLAPAGRRGRRTSGPSDVPLAEQAVAILEGLMRRSPLVFPAQFARDGHTEPRPLSGFGRAKERLDGLMLEELRKVGPRGDAARLDASRLAPLGGVKHGPARRGGARGREAAQPRLGHLRGRRWRLPAS